MFLWFLLILRPQSTEGVFSPADRRPKRLTVSPEVDVATLMTANPLLRRLAMFADTPLPTTSIPSDPPSVDKMRFPQAGDNFDALYRRMNETFFGMAVPESRQIVPTGRPLSDEHLPKTENSNKNNVEESVDEEDPPFAVTESLLTAIQATEQPQTIHKGPQPSSEEQGGWTETPPTTRTFSPAAERVTIKSDVVEEVTTEISSPPSEDDFQTINSEDDTKKIRNTSEDPSPQNILKGLAPLRRSSDWQVHRNPNGKYLVSGTRYYEDNRVTGGVMAEEYQPSANQWELRHIQNDPRFAVEAELTKMRAHAELLKKVAKPIYLGSKAGSSFSRRKGFQTVKVASSLDLEEQEKVQRQPEKTWPSTARISEEKGKTFEKRRIEEAGEKVEVSVSDRRLFGHDIYSFPGAVIHGPLKQKSRPLPRKSISRCFDSTPKTTLVGVIPFDRRIGNSPNECLRVCAIKSNCRAVVYDDVLYICDIFSEKPGSSGAAARPSSSSTLFEPNVEDPSTCLQNSRTRVHAAPVVTVSPVSMSTVTLNPLVNEDMQIVDRDAGHCPPGEEFMFAQMEGIRGFEKRRRRRRKGFVTNEDDCVFACLTDNEMESRGPCGAAEYSHETQECVLYNRLPEDLEGHETTTLYHKICVTAATNLACSGATLEHVQQMVLYGAMREVKSVESRATCISECVSAHKTAGYNCLSVMFYPNERNNCILNDASFATSPDSFALETKKEVEYFGVDECYGLEDVTQKKEANTVVEDDVRVGQITRGSRVESFN